MREEQPRRPARRQRQQPHRYPAAADSQAAQRSQPRPPPLHRAQRVQQQHPGHRQQGQSQALRVAAPIDVESGEDRYRAGQSAGHEAQPAIAQHTRPKQRQRQHRQRHRQLPHQRHQLRHRPAVGREPAQRGSESVEAKVVGE